MSTRTVNIASIPVIMLHQREHWPLRRQCVLRNHGCVKLAASSRQFQGVSPARPGRGPERDLELHRALGRVFLTTAARCHLVALA